MPSNDVQVGVSKRCDSLNVCLLITTRHFPRRARVAWQITALRMQYDASRVTNGCRKHAAPSPQSTSHPISYAPRQPSAQLKMPVAFRVVRKSFWQIVFTILCSIIADSWNIFLCERFISLCLITRHKKSCAAPIFLYLVQILMVQQWRIFLSISGWMLEKHKDCWS